MSLTDHLLLFIRIVDKGNFSAAARDLGITTSAVSRQFRQLEDELGLRLLNRTTRKIKLTEEGKHIYESAKVVARELTELESFAMNVGDRIMGTLNVTSTVAFGKAHLLPLIPEFLNQYPDLDLVLELSDRSVDLVSEEKDIAVQFAEQLDNRSMIVRRLATNHRFICASPEYLSKYGEPLCPDDLTKHNCLRSSTVEGWNGWRFEMGGTKKVVYVKGNFKANSADAIYRAALSGLGIARLSEYLIADDLRHGRLVRILDTYAFETSDLMAIYPDRRNLPPKVRVFLDYLVSCFTPTPPWV